MENLAIVATYLERVRGGVPAFVSSCFFVPSNYFCLVLGGPQAGPRFPSIFFWTDLDGSCRSRQAGGKREAEFRASPQTLFSSPQNVDVSFDRKFLVLGHSFLR